MRPDLRGPLCESVGPGAGGRAVIEGSFHGVRLETLSPRR